MPLKKHHKIIIGSAGSIVFVFMIVSGIFMYTLFIKQNVQYGSLDQRVTNTESNINTLTDNLIDTKSNLESTITTLNLKVGSIGQEMDLLKASASEDFSGIIENAVKGVVTIRTDVGQGTGFLITQDGYILTNAHVLVDAKKVQAITYEQEILEAEFIGYEGRLDIAVLKIPGIFEELSLGDSDNIEIGEKVIAIGNPLGLQFSVSEGIVSGVHRIGPSQLEAYIQTDAALNPGNSGGPLIDKQGKVIGINNFKISGGESLGFALESNYLKDAVNEIALDVLEKELI